MLFFTRESQYNATALLTSFHSRQLNPIHLLPVTSYDFYANLAVTYAKSLVRHTGNEVINDFFHALLQNEMSDELATVLRWFLIAVTKQIIFKHVASLIPSSRTVIQCPALFAEIGRALLHANHSPLLLASELMIMSLVWSLPHDTLSSELEQWCNGNWNELLGIQDITTYATQEKMALLTISDPCERDERFWMWSIAVPLFLHGNMSTEIVLDTLFQVVF